MEIKIPDKCKKTFRKDLWFIAKKDNGKFIVKEINYEKIKQSREQCLKNIAKQCGISIDKLRDFLEN